MSVHRVTEGRLLSTALSDTRTHTHKRQEQHEQVLNKLWMVGERKKTKTDKVLPEKVVEAHRRSKFKAAEKKWDIDSRKTARYVVFK